MMHWNLCKLVMKFKGQGISQYLQKVESYQVYSNKLKIVKQFSHVSC